MDVTTVSNVVIRNDTRTSTAWSDRNPVLKRGAVGVESGGKRIKIGNGTDHWLDLPYVGEAYAEKLKKAVQIAIEGDVNGAVFFDGSQDVTIFAETIFDEYPVDVYREAKGDITETEIGTDLDFVAIYREQLTISF